MTLKTTILLGTVGALLLAGCGEDYSTGVIKGGTGNGKPLHEANDGTPDSDLSQEPEYRLSLSEPAADICHGIKRALVFLNPLTLEKITENQILNIKKQDNLDKNIILQITWENQSSQPKTIIQPACQNDIALQIFNQDATPGDPRCDIKTPIILEPHDIYLSEHSYNLSQSSSGIFRQNSNIEFLPLENSNLNCDDLAISYSIFTQ